MRRTLFLFLLLVATIATASSTLSKIKDSKRNLQHTAAAKKAAQQRLEKIAADIKATEAQLAKLGKKIAELESSREANERRLEELKRQLQEATKAYTLTSDELQKKRQRFMRLASERIALIEAIKATKQADAMTIVKSEIYTAYKRYTDRYLKRLHQEIGALKHRKRKSLAKRRSIEKEIARIEASRKRYEAQKREKEKLLKRLADDEERYTKRLEALEDKQNDLRETLAKLNILRQKEVEEARRRAEARKRAIRLERERKRKLRLARARARAKARKAREALRRAKKAAERAKAKKALEAAQKEAKQAYAESQKVRKINSSYKKPSVYRYRGGKTFSPLPGAKLVRSFGTYIDPIYKIKIFNDGITLKAPRPDATVRVVLGGKVVFAGETSMLGKAVVVYHGSGMHTIYAGLSKIAPTIHKGSKIAKGYIIGKVHKKLIFQATKNSKHINPLRLIRL